MRKRLEALGMAVAIAAVHVLVTPPAGAAPPASTTTTLEVQAQADYGSPVPIVVNVADAGNAAGYPLGWVQILEGEVQVDRVQLWSGRGYTEIRPAIGSHSYHARYEGSADHATSESGPGTVVVGKAPTIASVGGTTSARVGERVTFTASAGPTDYRWQGTSVASGEYSLYLDGELVGTKTVQAWGGATFELTFDEAGDYVLEATYSGNDSFDPADSEPKVFTAVPYDVGTMIGSSKGGSSYSCPPDPETRWPECAPNALAGEPVIFMVTVYPQMDQKPNPPAMPGGYTTFYVNNEPIGTVPTVEGRAVITATLEVGSYWIHAIYHGDEVFNGAVTGSMPFWVAAPALPPPPPVPPIVDPVLDKAGTPKSGYWMVAADGTVYNFGDAAHYGNGAGRTVDLEPTPSGGGYWLLRDQGEVLARGNAVLAGGTVLAVGEKAVSLSATPTGLGYWIFTDRGRVIAKGDARFLGDMAKVPLNAPVLDSISTPTGNGYWMVAADGGIFTFGDAVFSGSTGHLKLNSPVISMAADPDGRGYWLVAGDGGIFAFDAPFRGSMGSTRLNKPISGIVPAPNGYVMVAEDGGIFSFSSVAFSGSLGATPPASPVVAVALLK